LYSKADVDFSQSRVAANLRCGGILNDNYIAYVPENVPVKKVEKRLIFSYAKKLAAYFFGHSVYIFKVVNITAAGVS